MPTINSFFKLIAAPLARSKRTQQSVSNQRISTGEQQLLKNHTTLVTGATSNIGLAIAHEMAAAGANIVVADIDQAASKRMTSEFAGYSGWLKFISCDVTESADIDILFQTLSEQNIYINTLVNNVGVQYRTSSLFDFEFKEWQDTFSTNVFGPMYLTKRIARSMMDNNLNGSIIFITSIHQWTVRKYASYSASKAALGMIIKELAVDLAPYGIRVNGIAPGWVALDDNNRPRQQKEALLHQTAVQPCHIGRTAVFLASNYYSASTTGTVITVDNGLSLYNHLTQN